MRQPGFLQPTSALAHRAQSHPPSFQKGQMGRARRAGQAAAVPASATRGRGAGGTRLPPSPPPARLPESSRRLRRRLQTQALSAMAATATPPATSGATRSPGEGSAGRSDGGWGAGAGAGLEAGLAAGAHLSRPRSGSWAGHLQRRNLCLGGAHLRVQPPPFRVRAPPSQWDVSIPPLPCCVSPGRCPSGPVSSSEKRGGPFLPCSVIVK